MTSEQQGGVLGDGEDTSGLEDVYKQAALDSAVEYTYALKLGKELGISVSNEEIDKAFNDHRRVGGVERSEEAFLKIVSDNFGMNKTEYRRMLYLTLMKAKVSQAIDTNAEEVAKQIEQLLAENGGDMMAIMETLGDGVAYEETGQLVDNMNVDGGRSNMAMTMEVGTVSNRFLSSNGDGYYFVKLIEKTDSQVNYASLKVMLTEFDLRIAELYEEGKVKAYIEIKQENEVEG